MYPRNRAALPCALALSLTAFAVFDRAAAQSATSEAAVLPPVTVEQSKPKEPKKKTKSAKKSKPKIQSASAPSTAAAAPASANASQASALPAVGTRSGSLTSPTEAEARAEINRTPGGVSVVSGASYQNSTPTATLKDALDYVPGVMVPRSEAGEAHRFSIRGSGLSRTLDTRGVQVLQDGVIPLTRASGDTSFDELDLSAYRYIEVFKGANALQYGANGLGGAVNLVTPTGYDSHLFGASLDVGSFGYRKWSLSSGAVSGPADYFVHYSDMQEDGYREHNEGRSRQFSSNIGFRLGSDAETRFYLDASETSRLWAGNVTKASALNTPEKAGPSNIPFNVGKDAESFRFANKTTVRLMPGTSLEFGGFYLQRDIELRVPISFQESSIEETGGFVRVVNDQSFFGHRDRLVAGVSIHHGDVDRSVFQTLSGRKGALGNRMSRDSDNTVLYAENSFFALPELSIITGIQHSIVSREQTVAYLAPPPVGVGPLAASNVSGDYYLTSPKLGVLWDVTPRAQIFANVSKSAEAPTYDADTAVSTRLLNPQTATTYELGTRGRTPDFIWMAAIYRSKVENEFQTACLNADCTKTAVSNLPRTLHQGIELGGSLALARGLLERGKSGDSLWLNAAYTLNDFTFDNDAVLRNNELPGQPRHYLRAELLYKHPSGIYVGPNVEWVPQSYYVDNINTATVDAYALLGAKLGFDTGGRLSWYVEGRNLTDKTYIASSTVLPKATAGSSLFFPGDGRSVFAGVRVHW